MLQLENGLNKEVPFHDSIDDVNDSFEYIDCNVPNSTTEQSLL